MDTHSLAFIGFVVSIYCDDYVVAFHGLQKLKLLSI